MDAIRTLNQDQAKTIQAAVLLSYQVLHGDVPIIKSDDDRVTKDKLTDLIICMWGEEFLDDFTEKIDA